MEVQLMADGVQLGAFEARVLDTSMGVIGGVLNPLPVYYAHYQAFFRAHSLQPAWKELEALKLLAVSNKLGILAPVGGIGVTDVVGFEEVTVEVAGLSADIMCHF